jgi:CubicO group peptidase (beta-lactamase class C family)
MHGHTSDGQAREDVTSIQKSIVGLLIFIAASRGTFDPRLSVSNYLGSGWSEAPVDAEDIITVDHLTAMASGLDRELHYVCPPVTRWDYNTRGYTKARLALEAGVGLTVQEMTERWLCQPLGLENSRWVPRPRNPKSPLAFVTTARDLARIGELLLGRGRVGDEQLIDDRLFEIMTTPSQSDNPSYGRFWWLNGQHHWIAPRADRYSGMRLHEAPNDTVMAYGRFSRYLWVAPSRDLVVVRLGGAPPDEREFERQFWLILSGALQ